MSDVIQISLHKYNVFCNLLKNEIGNILTFELFKNSSLFDLITEVSKQIFCDEIYQITSLLSNPRIAISAFDVPISDQFNEELNTILGVGIFVGIFNNIGHSSIDSSNNIPFTIHVASHSNVERLESLDKEGASIPEIKLGFHNDGLLTSSTIELPNHIGLYNVYIGYHNPGNFMWMPTALWDESSKYRPAPEKKEIMIKTTLTPSFYTHQNNEMKFSSFKYVTAPLSIINETGEQRFFLNGQVRLEENPVELVEIVGAIRDSLQHNDKKFYIPQKERRGIILKNTLGFHARDVFQSPIQDVDLSRVLIRTVDLNSEHYPSIRIE